MSITFTTPNAPRTKVPCEFCAQERDWAAEDGREVVVNEHGGCCDPWCNGTQEVSQAPEANFSETNARGVLALMGLLTSDGDLYGEAPVSTIRRGLVRAMNTDRSHLETEAFELSGGHAGTVFVKDEDGIDRIERMGARAFFGGNTDEQTVRRLAAIQTLCHWAENNGFDTICWA